MDFAGDRAPARLPSATMNQIAFVFPGQGSQFVGMGRALAETSPAAAAVFAAADAALGEPISRLAWEGPEEDAEPDRERAAGAPRRLDRLPRGRPRAVERRSSVDIPDPAFAAGHSMGQYTALVAAGALDLADAVRLVRTRGQLMQASGAGREGRMAAIIGLDDARLPELVAAGVRARHLRRREPQLARPGRGLGRAAGRGGRPRHRPGARRQARHRAARSPSPPTPRSWPRRPTACAGSSRGSPSATRSPPLLANADAHLITTADGCRAELVDHLTTGVDWVGAVEAMHARGVTTFIEIGPGRVLTGLIRRIALGRRHARAGRPGRGRSPVHPLRRHRRRRRRLTACADARTHPSAP